MKRVKLSLGAAICGLFFLIALYGCDGGDDSDGGDTDVTGIDFQDFRAEVARAAGDGATDCGDVPVNGDRSEVNCCIASNFSRALPAYATFMEQGIDSQVARGVSSDAVQAVEQFFFDSDPSGSARPNNGRIYQSTCESSEPKSDVCSDTGGSAFECANGGGDTDVTGIDFQDFRAEVARAAGDGATDCGDVPVNGDRSEVNCCIASNFSRALPAYATFMEQGIDSQVARGVSSDAVQAVEQFFFDSDPSGSARPNNGRIYQSTCESSEPKSDVCSDTGGSAFECAN